MLTLLAIVQFYMALAVWTCWKASEQEFQRQRSREQVAWTQSDGSHDELDECCICFEDLGSDARDVISLRPCGHWMHRTCVLAEMERCPVCMTQLEDVL